MTISDERLSPHTTILDWSEVVANTPKPPQHELTEDGLLLDLTVPAANQDQYEL